MATVLITGANRGIGLELAKQYAAAGDTVFRTMRGHDKADGPVGAMLTATKRHAMRPGHIHFAINKPGFDPLITHVFIDNDEYLDSDAVFGVRSSCIGNYVRHEAGVAPDGKKMSAPYHTLNYKFVLAPAIVHAKAA